MGHCSRSADRRWTTPRRPLEPRSRIFGLSPPMRSRAAVVVYGNFGGGLMFAAVQLRLRSPLRPRGGCAVGSRIRFAFSTIPASAGTGFAFPLMGTSMSPTPSTCRTHLDTPILRARVCTCRRPTPPPRMWSSAVPRATDYRSLRRKAASRAERFELGRSLRVEVPRKALGVWKRPPDRVDPVEQIKRSHTGRLEELIPIRVGRMAARRTAFCVVAPSVMAGDVAGLPATGITPVICGDAHLGNFGFYASPERDLVHRPERLRRGPSRCLGVGLAPPRRQHLGRRSAKRLRRSAVRRPRSRRAWLPTARNCAFSPVSRCCYRSYQRLDVDASARNRHREVAARRDRAAPSKRARSSTSDRVLPRLTIRRSGQRDSIVERPPLITRVPAAAAEQIGRALDEYLATLAPHWRRALGGYTLVDVAHKVVGVGSVGPARLRRAARGQQRR